MESAAQCSPYTPIAVSVLSPKQRRLPRGPTCYQNVVHYLSSERLMRSGDFAMGHSSPSTPRLRATICPTPKRLLLNVFAISI
jgi:hypothetical protein